MLSERQAEFLFAELCVEYGVCLSAAARAALLARAPSDAETFTLGVFRAEGLEPIPSHRQLYRAMLAHVERAYERAAVTGTET